MKKWLVVQIATGAKIGLLEKILISISKSFQTSHLGLKKNHSLMSIANP
jgi:hypothetical protein